MKVLIVAVAEENMQSHGVLQKVPKVDKFTVHLGMQEFQIWQMCGDRSHGI